MKYKIVLNLYILVLYIYNAFQNEKDFDGEDIATNYPPRDGSAIPLSSCNFSHEMGPYAWGSKRYGF
jgi:hypothetical protein